MIRIFPFIFVILWSSAFITTKPIIDNSDPFAALAFRFGLVAFGFFLFSIYSKKKFCFLTKIFCFEYIEYKKKPKATKANLKARAANGSLLSIMGLVVMKAEDHRITNMKGNILIIMFNNQIN